jgi:hypothetical protein
MKTLPSQKGKGGRPARDRTGDVYGGLRVLRSARHGCDFGWLCECLSCGREWFVQSKRMSEAERGGYGCGCRRKLMAWATASVEISRLQGRVRLLEERMEQLTQRRIAKASLYLQERRENNG